MTRGEASGRWVRLQTLTTLRWLAVIGQATAVIAADQVFGVQPPRALCALAIAVSVIFNVIAMQVFPATMRLSQRAATFSMLFDLGQVSILLMMTGGLANPFAMLMLAPVTISASALTLRSTLVVSAAALGLIALMSQWSLPLILASGERLTAPPIYIFGIWVALTISVLFMTFYARRVSVETYRMSRALREAEAALAREQRLTAIGGLAAAAAHELGTPLATIKLVSAELAGELSDQPELREDAELIRAQADRCRDILADLAQGGRADAQVRSAPASAVIHEAAEPHADRGRRIILRIDGRLAETVGDAQPILRRTPELVHGLRNLVQNAVDFAATTIWIDVNSSGAALRITIGDDGPGFPEELLQRLGDPYVTSRARAASRPGRSGGAGEPHTGMGLGLFIAKTLLERTGARLSFANSDRAQRRGNRGVQLERQRPPGAVVAAVWPEGAIIAPKVEARSALGRNERFTLDNI
ncbi:ActS/PrrB/RegB family redox-sensitive histidine kinase [Pikeienuella piscinae]|uniref:histidine kinase n=2 Tax=Pikeienuella piscinae TaxID=2748098 RepID=A0A7M3T7H5_9RHOB|nr:ActS/PrrB/RegB family redox-sensitive histidine kinase [Pikeienuella piscinae]